MRITETIERRAERQVLAYMMDVWAPVALRIIKGEQAKPKDHNIIWSAPGGRGGEYHNESQPHFTFSTQFGEENHASMPTHEDREAALIRILGGLGFKRSETADSDLKNQYWMNQQSNRGSWKGLEEVGKIPSAAQYYGNSHLVFSDEGAAEFARKILSLREARDYLLSKEDALREARNIVNIGGGSEFSFDRKEAEAFNQKFGTNNISLIVNGLEKKILVPFLREFGSEDASSPLPNFETVDEALLYLVKRAGLEIHNSNTRKDGCAHQIQLNRGVFEGLVEGEELQRERGSSHFYFNSPQAFSVFATEALALGREVAALGNIVKPEFRGDIPLSSPPIQPKGSHRAAAENPPGGEWKAKPDKP